MKINTSLIYQGITLFLEIVQINPGEVLLYISEKILNINYVRTYIFVEGEFEYIFLETVINNNKTVIGEIYRVPNSNINQSILKIKRYKKTLLLEMIKILNYLKLNHINKL